VYFIGNNKITENGLPHAQAWQQLRNLSIKNLPIRGMLEVFARLPHLEVLSAINCNLNENDLASLAQATQLRDLQLWKHAIRRGLRYASGCKELEVVDISDNPIDLEGVKELHLLKRLRTLYASHTPIDDERFAVISSLGRLQKLSVAYTNLTPFASEFLKNLRELTNLSWPSSAISFDNVRDFTDLPQLEQLDISGTKPLPKEIVNAMKSALPSCEISFPIRL